MSTILPNNQIQQAGGSIKISSDIFFWVSIVILIICILWLIIIIFKNVRVLGEDFNQRKTRQHFNNIHGEEFDDDAKQTIQYGEAIEEPRAIDHYRMGTVYLLNARNHQAAHRHFRQALDQIINGQVNTREAPFILNRIGDFNDHFVDFPDLDDDLPIQHALHMLFNQQAAQIKQVEKKKVEIAKDDPEFRQKTIISRQDWQSDSQNVHDTAIYKELKDQISRVIDDNSKLKDIQLHGYDEAVNWLRVRYKDNTKKHDMEKVINVINNDYSVGSVPGLTEKQIITAVWQRTFDPENKDNASQIREAMGDAVLDCVEGGAVVCMFGRSSKVWQALAKLDKDPNIGIFKTKQALRNEIYDKAAKILDDFVGINGSASQSLKESYIKDENTEQVKELKEHINSKLSELANDYKELLSPDQLDIIIAECKAVV